ncbi:MAG TPA: LytTR family transcriptional regulator DNA-binding domain-containing protein, partial [Allosphingosinicella sp.]
YDAGMLRRLLLLALLLLPAAASAGPAIEVGAIRACAPAGACETVDLQTFALDGREKVIEREVRVAPAALPLPRPLMVYVFAMASSEIRWNGVPIGRNGVPGPDAAHEVPGRFIASFTVPAELVRPGVNTVEARLSAHHLWLPVRRPIHVFDVGYYESPRLPGLAGYLPALLALGALAAGAVYFAAAAWLDRSDRRSPLLAAIAAVAILQLGVETSRSFVAYAYPWHLVRVAAVALLAAVIAVLIAAYAARRFQPWRSRTAPAVTAAVAFAGLILIPWYDLKAIAAIAAGAAALLACAAGGARRRIPGARPAIGFALLLFALIGWQLTDFLDQSYYVALAAILVVLVGEQLLVLRQARSAGEREALRAAGLEARLDEAAAAGPEGRIARLKDGARTHQVPEARILFVRAADDYCEVRLEDGRTLLVTMSLARLHQALSERFVRIHKSYSVNSARVAALGPRPGGGKQLTLADGTVLPVGRAYLGAVAAMRAD